MSSGLPLPRLTPESAFFWTSGADGTLSFLRCGACGLYLHPPTPQCRRCGSEDVAPTPVSGRGTLWSYTTSHQKLLPDVEVPYTVALVALEEQDDLHLTSRLVGIAPDDVRIGMPLRVVFEQHGEVFVPLFEEASA
ncbi:MAG: 3-ketoacyl-CoA thiolase [Frankiales bacterium]|nr:3-ketoacyl-CoA thiolase [Frankiales bacterium]